MIQTQGLMSGKSAIGPSTLSVPILILLAFGLLLLRAWPRLLYPEVWAEDGTENMYGLIQNGPLDIFRPIGGYLVLIPKLISLLSLSISFAYYPIISTVFAWVFTIFVFVVIAKAPTQLKGQLFLATSCMLIPSDPECFGLPLYTYWWSALLLFLIVFWQPGQSNIFRAMLIGLCSLTSPVCLITLPLFWIRVLTLKAYRCELYLAILASVCVGVQLYVMHFYGKPAEFNFGLSYLAIKLFLGTYVIGNIYPQANWPLGILLLAFLSTGLVGLKNKSLYGLYYLLFISILMSIYRVDIAILNPINAGPRYFFFPYILLSWLLIQLVFFGRYFLVKVGAALFFASSVVNAIPHLGRQHDRLNWKGNITECLHSEKAVFLVHYAGSASNAWNFVLNREQCRKLVANDLFYRE